MEKYKCKYCNKEFKRPCGLAIHEKTCKENPNREPLKNHKCGFAIYWNKNKGKPKKEVIDIQYCHYCGKECKNANSLRNHERLCKENPNHQESSWIKFNHERGAWNKGLSKETDERIKKSSTTLKKRYEFGELISPQKGKHHTKEEKQNLSKKMKDFLSKNPDKNIYIKYHHSKGDSYPEKYFKEFFDKNNIEYKQNYYQSGYFLDFAWPDKKIYLEIDGEQHYFDKRIVEHDKIRTQNLLNNGWRCIDRIRWRNYNKLNESQKKDILDSLLSKILE